MRHALAALVLLAAGCTSDRPDILDKDELLASHVCASGRPCDPAWWTARVPFFESPDPAIDSTYWYRWELVTRHLTYGSPESGWLFTEFLDRPFWSGAFGAISCPLGHQFYEIRWLKDRRVAEDYARYWFETPGAQPRSYSNWYGDAMWAVYAVQADTGFLRRVYPYMEAQVRGWGAEHWDSAHGMYRWDGMHDGMETNINSRLTADRFAGAEGFRPTLNSYLYGDLRALARTAALFGDTAKASAYAARAAALKGRVQGQLWDSTRTFFFHQFARDEQGGITAKSLTYRSGPYRGDPHGREEIGFVPWQFHLPDPGYEAAWRSLTDTSAFAAPFGPTTVERGDPQFRISPNCCVWSGQSWPYATTQTLVAMANLLNDYTQSVVTPADWFALFRTYTLTQRKNGAPYIAEAANPLTGSWDGHDSWFHSEHYFHSGYVDLVITGLVGLRPRADDTLEVRPLAPASWAYLALDDVAYHGHRVAVVWDRDGKRYGRGKGLLLYVDGRRVAQSDSLQRLTAALAPPPRLDPPDRPVNLAVNNGRGPFPWLFASHSAPDASPHWAIDGQRWYDAPPAAPNRWTTTGSHHPRDTLILDFGAPRRVEQLALHILDDGAGIRPPVRFEVRLWDGRRWVSPRDERRTPRRPEGGRANLVTFAPDTASRLRVVLWPRPGRSLGLTEIEAWSHAALPLPAPTAASWNLAWGARVSASYTSPWDRVDDVNDMAIAFTGASRNRWTAWDSKNAADWVELDFGAPKQVGSLDLYLWGDGRGVKAPKRIRVQTWDGTAWADARIEEQVPERPTTFAMNTLRIRPVTTTRLRVVFEHDLPAFSGMTELMVREDQP